MKKTYLVWFDKFVTDDRIIYPIVAEDEDECDKIAFLKSMQSGLSEGNYEIFVSIFDTDQHRFIKETAKKFIELMRTTSKTPEEIYYELTGEYYDERKKI